MPKGNSIRAVSLAILVYAELFRVFLYASGGLEKNYHERFHRN